MILEKIKKDVENSMLKNEISIIPFLVEKTKNISFGDFSCNVALVLAKQLNKNPMEIAELIVKCIDANQYRAIEISKPGFINFKLSNTTNLELIKTILKQNKKFPVFPKTKKVFNVEYVSANPTGYLHIGHARNAVFGDTIVSLLKKTGNKVISEYIVNDAGNQMNMLASSVLVRYKQLLNQQIELPQDSYHGEEIKLVASELLKKYNNIFQDTKINDNFVIEDQKVRVKIRKFARDYLLNQIKKDLANIGTIIDIYYSETKIHKSNLIPKTIKKLGDNVFEKDGAIWLNTTKYGDDKDRVLIKSDKTPTYFMPDIAYHNIKLNRFPKPDKIINVWGADHYSYITRMKIALEALGYSPDKLEVLCMQMVRLVKNGQEFKMSKRSGQSLTLMDLVNAIGKDNARWFLLSSSPSTHIELDVDLATQKDNKNPIYYVQYAHARANTLLTKAENINLQSINTNLLNTEIEQEILQELNYFANCVQSAAKTYEPFRITNYAYNLAKLFHNYYSNVAILNVEDQTLKSQRIALVAAVKIILANALVILGIQPYERM